MQSYKLTELPTETVDINQNEIVENLRPAKGSHTCAMV